MNPSFKKTILYLLIAYLVTTFFGFTLQEFYLDYQPWISLTYVMIFLSPWLARRALRNVPISS